MEDKKLIIAFDFPYEALEQAKALAQKLDPTLCRLKVGKQMFTDHGPAFLQWLQDKNFEIFLDLKFHDIPSTVAKALEAARRLGVWMVNVHSLGGEKMLSMAREALPKGRGPLLIGVTVLTSMDAHQLATLGIQMSPQELALKLARLAHQAQLDGVVCSAQESPDIKAATESGFLTICPGIRPKDAPVDDQSRIVTPNEAVALGADYLVVGRPVTQAEEPMAVVTSLLSEL